MALILTLLGIGFILFIHEGGHFLAARKAGVRVEVFSLGFGPRLFGWKKGDTDYRISLLPLGGYVRLAGEEMAGESRPGDLGAATPNQRLLIFAGGILMNFAFALLVIPLLFRIGVPFEVPVAGAIEAGSPAWQAGIREGDTFDSVNGEEIYAFRSFAAAIALGDSEQITIRTAPRNGENSPQSFTLKPEYDASVGFRRIGVSPAGFDPKLLLQIAEDSKAAAIGLRSGDRLTAINGIACNSTQDARILLQDAATSGNPVSLSYFRQNGSEKDFGEVEIPLTSSTDDALHQVGIRRAANHVKQNRGEGIIGFREGDIILSVAGKKVQRVNDLAVACLTSGQLPEVTILREGKTIELPAIPGVTAAQILELLWLDEGNEFRIALVANSPASAVMNEGDILLQAAGQPISDLNSLRKVVGDAKDKAISFTWSRQGEVDPMVASITPAFIPHLDADFALKAWNHTVKRNNVIDALKLGIREAHRMVKEIGATLSGMFSGRVASENIGGIITIGRVAHNFAAAGIGQLLFFLAMISVHLGVLNLLPIPALDGGHILFVLYEKLRGKPLSPQVQGVFNLVGVALLLSLVIFVTRNDLRMLMG